MPAVSPSAPLPANVDVVIIGAGYTGLSAARIFARSGVRVAVLEAETIGWGASSRNGGMVLTGLKVPIRQIQQRHGKEIARQLFQCSLDSIDMVAGLIEVERIDCGFARTGHLLTANKRKHFEAFGQEIDYMAKEFNYSLELVPPGDLATEIASDAYHGGLRDARSGGLNPARYVAGLARAARSAGASIHVGARVTGLERANGDFSVQTPRGRIRAERVLVATAGYTAAATPEVRRRIIPIGSFIIATETLPGDLAASLIPKNRMIFDSRHFLNYFRIWENRLIFGGRAAFFPETEDTVRRSAEILRRQLAAVFPQLQSTKIEYAWGGTLDFAFDMLPHVGQMDGVSFALGYAGHGVAMATYLGATLAEAILAGTVREHPFASLPFPAAPLGLYRGWPWFLPLAGLYYRLLDWVA